MACLVTPLLLCSALRPAAAPAMAHTLSCCSCAHVHGHSLCSISFWCTAVLLYSASQHVLPPVSCSPSNMPVALPTVLTAGVAAWLTSAWLPVEDKIRRRVLRWRYLHMCVALPLLYFISYQSEISRHKYVMAKSEASNTAHR
jgi:hypothetical protein